MKFTKLCASGMAATALMMSLNSVLVSASDTKHEMMEEVQALSDSVPNGDYFSFTESGDDRIDSAGNFTFQITYGIDSTAFYVKNSTIQILINATGSGEGSGLGVTVFIMKSGTDEIAGVNTFPCDGEDHIKSYSGLDTSQKYYLKILNHSGSAEVEGYGRVGWYDKA